MDTRVPISPSLVEPLSIRNVRKLKASFIPNCSIFDQLSFLLCSILWYKLNVFVSSYHRNCQTWSLTPILSVNKMTSLPRIKTIKNEQHDGHLRLGDHLFLGERKRRVSWEQMLSIRSSLWKRNIGAHFSTAIQILFRIGNSFTDRTIFQTVSALWNNS